MQYTRRSFSVSSVSSKQNGPRGEMCVTKGHSALDARGRCLCCGELVPIGEVAPNELMAE